MDNNDLKLNQRVYIQRERGDREPAVVKGLTRNGKVVVQLSVDHMLTFYDVVDREDISQ